MRTEKDTLVEQLREAVRGREREKALELLKKGALDGLTKEQRLEIYKSLMTLRNMEIIHYLAKQEEKFSSEMLRMDFEPYLNKNFVRQVLARYRKKFDLTDERECENLFEIACEANDAETVKYLIRQGRGKNRYALLGEAELNVFQQSASIPQDALTQDAWMELLFSAAASDQKAPLPKSPGGSYNGGAGGRGGNHRLRRVLHSPVDGGGRERSGCSPGRHSPGNGRRGSDYRWRRFERGYIRG